MEPVREITERYRIGEVLASDPSLTVCTATDASSGAQVVVEVVAESRGATAGAASRFMESVAALARLHHSSLPAVADGGVTDDGAVFLVRESVDGRPFHTLGGESPGQILSLLLQVVGGLELLAAEGFQHGALSLDTLWVAAGPERPRAKIVGLAPGVWRSRQPGADAAAARAEDLRSLGAVACRLLGATVSDPASAAPRVKLPLAVAFELEDADALRRLLERCLHADPAARPAGHSEVRTEICVALWGEAEAGLTSASGASGAPPARLTFTTVPEDSLVRSAPPPAPAPAQPARDEGEITKVVLPEDLDGLEAGPAEDTAEVRERARRAEAAEAVRRQRPAPPPALPRQRDAAPAPPKPPPPPPAVRLASPPTAAAAASPVRPSPPPSPPAAGVAEPDEMLTPISFLPTGEETLSEARRPGRAVRGSGAAGLAGAVPPPPPQPPVAAVPPPPSAPPPTGIAAASPAAVGALPAAPARAVKGPSAKVIVLAALAAGLLLAVVAAGALLFWFSRRQAEPVVERPSPAVQSPADSGAGTETGLAIDELPDPRLLAALESFAAGDEGEARKTLAAIPAEDQAAFSAGECALLDLLGESVSRAGEERASESLAGGLASGDLARLRRGAAAVEGRESAFLARYPGSAADLDRARRVIAVLDRARAAAAGGEPVQVLEQVAVLGEIFPAWEGAQGLRESAATSLEGEADALFEQGRYDAALERLDALAGAWPEREGLTRRRELVRTRQAAERDLGGLLQAAERAAAEGRPDEGLELISGVTPPARMAARFAATRSDLERRLAEVDAAAPAVEVGGAAGAEYAKDEAAQLSFRVRDDYRIERVTVHARVAGEPWQVIPHSRGGGDARAGEYEVEIAPDFHRNEPIELYITATDPSGHTGGAGDADAPIEIKRRRWFRRLID